MDKVIKNESQRIFEYCGRLRERDTVFPDICRGFIFVPFEFHDNQVKESRKCQCSLNLGFKSATDKIARYFRHSNPEMVAVPYFLWVHC